MITGKKVSGFVVISEAVKNCYPFIESILSFLPVLDELVVVFNPYGEDDGTLKALEDIKNDPTHFYSEKLRIVNCPFNIEKYGFTSYGFVRTMGYQAVTGQVVLMFDCDGVLHENEQGLLIQEIGEFIRRGFATGYWEKHRIYKPELYYPQHKHSGIYNKEILGDRFDFFRTGGKGAPNFERLTPQEQSSFKFHTTLFGYEHIWDTEEIIKYKTNRYGTMIDSLHGDPIKKPEEYYKIYMEELVTKLAKDGLKMPLEKHPAIMRDRLQSTNETHFGFNFFNYQ